MVRHNLKRARAHPLVCVPTTQEYRQQANKYVTSSDVVLEVGSAHGVTTMLLATLCKSVVGVDCDPKMLEQARARYTRDNLAFFFYNVLEFPTTDWRSKIIPRGETDFSVVFIDCGGTIPVYMLAPMLEAIQACVKPRLIVCKSLNLFKLQRQLTDGLAFAGGESVPQSHISEQPATTSLEVRSANVRSGEDNRVQRMVDRLSDRSIKWRSAAVACLYQCPQPNLTASPCRCLVVQPHPEPIAQALSESTLTERRKALSVLKPWRDRAALCGIDGHAIVRAFPATSSPDGPLTALLLAPGESIPSKPWTKSLSTKVRALLTRDDYLAYCKWQLFSPFSHGLPVVLSTRLHEKIAAKPKARFLIEFAPGRYFDFVAEELVRTLKTVEMLNQIETNPPTTPSEAG